jgi:hypothetical protein
MPRAYWLALLKRHAAPDEFIATASWQERMPPIASKGDYLCAMRHAIGWSPIQAAQETGVAANYIRNLESTTSASITENAPAFEQMVASYERWQVAHPEEPLFSRRDYDDLPFIHHTSAMGRFGGVDGQKHGAGAAR